MGIIFPKQRLGSFIDMRAGHGSDITDLQQMREGERGSRKERTKERRKHIQVFQVHSLTNLVYFTKL